MKRKPLSKALLPGSFLVDAVRKGKQALTDPSRVVETDRSRVVESLDLDAATRREKPSEPRWDYLLGTSVDGPSLIGLEIHNATAKEVRGVIAKKAAALDLLKQEMVPGSRVKAWYWVASGKVALTRGTAEARLLDQAGIILAGAVLRLSSTASR